MQQLAGILRRSSRRAFSAPPLSLFLSPQPSLSADSHSRPLTTSSLHNHAAAAALSGSSINRCGLRRSPCSLATTIAPFCSVSEPINTGATEAVKEIYDKMVDSIKEKRSAPPNVWLWSLLENFKKQEDVVLLFDILRDLRVFRLSNLRIHDNFNCNLCQEITKACIRVGAIDFGKKALWKHNVYGLSPSVASANHLLSYAKKKKDPKLMEDIMKLIKRNDLPLQPSTADIVFSICHETDNWGHICKFSKRFQKAGVKLRKTAFDTWMDFAAKRGDLEALWKIEKLRSDVYKEHNLDSGFACAKGFLLERKPEEAASVIQVLNQTLADSKRPQILLEIQKLVSEWPSHVLKHQKEQDRKDLATALKVDIPAMVNSVLSKGVEASVNLEDLNRTEALLC